MTTPPARSTARIAGSMARTGSPPLHGDGGEGVQDRGGGVSVLVAVEVGRGGAAQVLEARELPRRAASASAQDSVGARTAWRPTPSVAGAAASAARAKRSGPWPSCS